MKHITRLIETALKEDNAWRDVTTRPLVPRSQRSTAELVAKMPGIVCGTDIFKKVFATLDRRFRFETYVKDGQKIRPGQAVLKIMGPTWALLSGERTALNFIQHLSGIATLTDRFVQATQGTRAKIFDTRKTLPGMRGLAKYAVRCGGGHNHRMSLGDMALIKDNHLKLVRDMKDAVARIKKQAPRVAVEIECEHLSQVREAIRAGADIIMLDNMDMKTLRAAIAVIKDIKRKKPEIEISGGVSLDTVRKFAGLGVDRISVGALTHSASALDLSLEIE